MIKTLLKIHTNAECAMVFSFRTQNSKMNVHFVFHRKWIATLVSCARKILSILFYFCEIQPTIHSSNAVVFRRSFSHWTWTTCVVPGFVLCVRDCKNVCVHCKMTCTDFWLWTYENYNWTESRLLLARAKKIGQVSKCTRFFFHYLALYNSIMKRLKYKNKDYA